MVMPERAASSMMYVGVATIIAAVAVLSVSFAFAGSGSIAPVPVIIVSAYLACLGGFGMYAARNTA